ncbi:LPS-assembly lipoprotein LptE [Thalassocella blandensis]|nr:LPS-assembly lipoprotein LptE [Thalassocella blandensis]
MFLSHAKNYLFRLSLIVMCLASCSCGWQLRGSADFALKSSNSLQDMDLTADKSISTLQKTVALQLDDLAIELKSASQHHLTLMDEKIERRPLAFSSTGIPIQYQLIMTVHYSFISQGFEERIINKPITARRNYDFDTALIVAKNEEERQLLQEMREELASRIIASAQKITASEQTATDFQPK